jgi:hypothetical protein
MLKVNTPVIINALGSRHHGKRGIINSVSVGFKSNQNIYGVQIVNEDNQFGNMIAVFFDDNLAVAPPAYSTINSRTSGERT